MPQTLSLITVVVDDYDRAIAHYCSALGFALREDTDLGGGKRWVRVAPAGSTERSIIDVTRCTSRALPRPARIDDRPLRLSIPNS